MENTVEQRCDIKVLINTNNSKFWVVDNYTSDIYQELDKVFVHEEPPIMVRGRECRQRRNVAFYSDESRGYNYSNQTMTSIPLEKAPILQNLLPLINKSLGTNFNGILVNKYINGEKYLSAHSDDEKDLDKTKNIVAGIAYGPGIRTFRIRNKHTKKIVLDYQHKPCTLIVMEGNFQKEFTHEIPIQKKIKECRISITFRHHVE